MPISRRTRTFSPIVLPDEALATMPKPARAAWAKYQKAITRHEAAKTSAVAAVVALRAARAEDTAAAVKAARANKTPPALTLPQAETDQAAAQRELEALATICHDFEREWTSVAEDHRQDWEAAISAHLDQLIAATLDQLNGLAEPLDDLAATEAVRIWLRPYPATRGLTDHPIGQPRPVGQSLAEVVKQVKSLGPTRADAETDRLAREQNRKDAIRAKYPLGVVPRGVDPATVT